MASSDKDKKSQSFPGAEQFIPERPTIPKMRAAIDGCRGCDLFKNATQGVFGEGPTSARIVLVGEQPGDSEDLEGHPFVGPSGKLLDHVLTEAGIDRREVYVTNAVKHFKFTRSAKRRLHEKPNAGEIRACSPWLAAELRAIKPEILVCLGATAARSVFGKVVTISKLRGGFHETGFSTATYVTSHPSALLRMPDKMARDQAVDDMIDDFVKIKKRISRRRP